MGNFYVSVLLSTTSIGWALLLGWVARSIYYSTGPKRAHLVSRLKIDYCITKKNFVYIIGAFITVMYIQGVIGRDLAYYRHYPLAHYVDSPEHLKHNRLEDVGFSLVADHTDSLLPELFGNILQYSFATMITVLCLMPYIKDIRKANDDQHFAQDPLDLLTVPEESVILAASPKKANQPVFTMWIASRLIIALGTGHALRMAVFLSTSLPGPAAHCVDLEMEAKHKPKNMEEIMVHPHVAGNCGDLIFSGHMLFAVTSCLTLLHYIPRVLGVIVKKDTATADAPPIATATNKPSEQKEVVKLPFSMDGFRVFLALLLVIQVYTLLASRSHYSVDMVVGCIVAYFNWNMHLLKWRSQEPHPSAAYLGATSDGSASTVIASTASSSPTEKKVITIMAGAEGTNEDRDDVELQKASCSTVPASDTATANTKEEVVLVSYGGSPLSPHKDGDTYVCKDNFSDNAEHEA